MMIRCRSHSTRRFTKTSLVLASCSLCDHQGGFSFMGIRIMKYECRPVKGYEGRYEVSNRGEVFSLPKNNRHYRLKITPVLIRGYERVVLSSNTEKRADNKNHFVHGLVASTFISDKPKDHEVNHKNGVKTDNKVENLEWVTSSENALHAYRAGLHSKNRGITGTNLETGNKVRFSSLSDATKYGFYISAIIKCCRGEFHQHKGYSFTYDISEERDTVESARKQRDRAVIGTCVTTLKEKYFSPISDASKEGFDISAICKCCSGKQLTHGEYSWRYAEAPKVKKKVPPPSRLHANDKAVAGFPQDGGTPVYYRSTREADRDRFDGSTISKCCRGKQEAHKGYHWKYCNYDTKEVLTGEITSRNQAVTGIHIETGDTVQFVSLKEAGRSGFNRASIAKCCRGLQPRHKGHVWKFT